MTIKEIAEALHVSTATVSNVIHGNLKKMSPQTAEIVRAKLEEYSYIPNMSARILAKGQSSIIGVITNYPNREEKFALQDPFVSEMIGALENTIRAEGYYMMLNAAQNANEITRIAHTWDVDGLIVMGLQANQCRELIKTSQKPIVFIDCYFDSGENYNNVGLDDQKGMYRLTRYLIKMGHRDMLFIGDQPVLWGVDAKRLQGHIDALASAGLEWDPANYREISKDRKTRKQDFVKLARSIRREKATAWMFTSDYYAVEAMNYLHDNGYHVPEDISVTGFDDNILAHVVRPRLTTVHQDVNKKADAAVKILLDIISGTTVGPVSVVLSPRTVHGNSIRIFDKGKNK